MRTLRVALALLLLFMTTLPGRAGENAADILGLHYSVQADRSLYFTGQYQGKPVHIVRKGLAGAGAWVIYAGPLNNRVRLTLDDKQGLVDVLAMDGGQRMTVRRIGKERIEYRLYGPDQRFVIGSVLFRKKGAWLQGLMQSEAFQGYGALTAVSDVSRKIALQSMPPPLSLAGTLARFWQRLDLLPVARADEVDDLIGHNARSRWGIPGDEMWKGALIGAAAFTVKLLGTGDTLVSVATVAVAAPFLTTVAIGVGVGLAADKVRNWANNRNLDNADAESYQSLVAETPFSKRPAPAPPPAQTASAARPLPAAPAPANSGESVDLLGMADQLDQLDQQDFRASIELAQACTRRHDFACTDEQLASARRRANNAADTQLIAATSQAARDEQRRIAEEAARLRAEEERRLAQAEEQRRAELQRQARETARAEAEESEAGGMQWGKAAALFGGSMIGGLSKLNPEVQGKIITGILKDSMAGQDGISNFNAALATRPATGAARSPSAFGAGAGAGASAGAGAGECPVGGPIITISSQSELPKACTSGREWHDAWALNEGSSAEELCAFTKAGTYENEKKRFASPSNGALAEGRAKHISPCYCGKEVIQMYGNGLPLACFVFYN